jgi:ketosteroid isomerase-like protein
MREGAPVDVEGLQAWMDRYVEAWRTYDAAAIGDLFSEDARYYTHPFRDPWQGRDEIVKGWDEDPDAPKSWEARYEALAAEGDVGVARGWTRYDDGKEYGNLFVIRFDQDGRAREFTEFFVKRDPEKSTAVSPVVPYTG